MTMSSDGRDVPLGWEGSPALVPRLSLTELANLVAEMVAQGTNSKGCVIRTVDRARHRTEVIASYGLGRDLVRMISEQDDSVAAALRGESTIVPDIGAVGIGNVLKEVIQAEGVASLATVPMTLRGTITGVLQVYGSEPGRFDDRDKQVLMAMGSVAAAAIESARLFERDRVLFEVARAVSSTLELREVAKLIAANTARAMGVKGCSVRLVDRNRRRLELLGSYGLSREYLEKGSVDVEKSIAEALEGRPVVVFDASNDIRVQYPDAAREEGICSIASVPMVLKGVTTGVLRVYTAVPYEFTPDDIEFLSALASAGAAAIENARLYDGIKQDFEVLMDEIVYMRRAARGVKKEQGV